jgi:Xaa-Pro aminopeptidase
MHEPSDVPTISKSEYAARLERVRAAAGERGLDMVIACSRGGGSLDRYANVMYLSGYYSAFPFITDLAQHWSARAHSFALVPVDGDPALVVDLPFRTAEQSWPGEVIVDGDVVNALAATIERLDLAQGMIGFAGSDSLPWSIQRRLAERFPSARWALADDVLDWVRAVKSPAESALLERASDLGSRTIDAMLDAAQPGVTHGDVVRAGLDVLVPAGGLLQNSFMSSGRGGPNPMVVHHTFPTWGAPTPLADGEWFHVGLSGVYHGYYFDLARSTAIGEPSAAQIALFEAAIAIVQAGVEAVRPGVTAGTVADACLAKMDELGYAGASTFAGCGHGIGLGWDLPWLVSGDPTVLEPGMVICIERSVTADGYLGDFEETVVVTEDGSRLLTSARVRRW